jgi:hypothetical protein
VTDDDMQPPDTQPDAGRPDSGPPRTDDAEIDDAMDQVRQLEDLPVADHHEVLAPAHDQLQQALQRDHSTPPSGPTGDRG